MTIQLKWKDNLMAHKAKLKDPGIFHQALELLSILQLCVLGVVPVLRQSLLSWKQGDFRQLRLRFQTLIYPSINTGFLLPITLIQNLSPSTPWLRPWTIVSKWRQCSQYQRAQHASICHEGSKGWVTPCKTCGVSKCCTAQGKYCPTRRRGMVKKKS